MNLYRFLIILLFIIKIINCQLIKANLNDLYAIIDSNYMNNVISNITSLLEGYVYLDIAKNPPNNMHEKIDLIKELKNINTKENSTYYEFYRNIKRIFAKVKDAHLNLIPIFNNAINYYACIPFSFNINYNTDDAQYYIYLKEYLGCPFSYNEDISSFINEAIKENVPIKSINGKDPFDFFQEFGTEFFSLKDNNSFFTAMINSASNFPLYYMPLNETELNLSINLTNGNQSNISYIIYKNDGSPLDPDINYSNNISLNWNYSTNGFKCRVDHINKVNVFVQNTFSFNTTQNIIELIYKCCKLFHSNEYKIVGIESRNKGGDSTISVYLQQLLQPKISTNKLLFSMRKNKFLKENFKYIKNNYLVFSTCEKPETYNKLFLKTDNYGENTIHNRTVLLDEIPIKMKNDLEKKRKEFLSKNTRKPTEIIIFTDYYSIGAASIFIKGFQQTGGAIIVGYFGNPNNNLNDSSISSSGSNLYDWTSEYQNLINLDFSIIITDREYYDYSYQTKNPFPQEYIQYPVDERVNIYENYKDDIYEVFIKEAKAIFDKYKDNCTNNNNFLLENSKCKKINGDEKKHGGFSCGSNGKWNTSNCRAFFCDLGYYYDTVRKKCVEDNCFFEEDEEVSFWVIMEIVGTGIIVLIIALILIKRTINFKKSKDEIEIIQEEKLVS